MRFLNLSVFIAVVSVFLLESAHAFSAVAWVEGTPVSYAAWNVDTQENANARAISGCKAEAKSTAVRSEKCKIALIGKRPGFGALACGERVCAAVTSAKTLQTAVDEAVYLCTKIKGNKNCSETPTQWEDWEGFSNVTKQDKSVQGTEDCRPRTSDLKCSSQCFNGDCTVTYTNGCKIRVQVERRHNPFSNQWGYSPPSC